MTCTVQAAIKQLEVLGKQIQVPVFSMGADVNPVTIAKEAVAHAIKHGNDPVILDTAGRLHIDEQLMDELANIKSGSKSDGNTSCCRRNDRSGRSKRRKII